MVGDLFIGAPRGKLLISQSEDLSKIVLAVEMRVNIFLVKVDEHALKARFVVKVRLETGDEVAEDFFVREAHQTFQEQHDGQIRQNFSVAEHKFYCPVVQEVKDVVG